MKKRNKILLLVIFIWMQISNWNNLAIAEKTSFPLMKEEQAINFEQYPAVQIKTKSVKKLILSTKLARQYKTVITLAMTKPANFSGHYRVVTWGCGTDCRGFAIINKRSGVVYTLPGVEYVAGVMGNEEERLDFRIESRLFVITGALNDNIEGKFYYLWEKNELKLLMKLPLERQSYSE